MRVELFFFSYPVGLKAYFTGAHTTSSGASYEERAKRIEGRNLSIVKVWPHLYELIMAKSQEQICPLEGSVSQNESRGLF